MKSENSQLPKTDEKDDLTRVSYNLDAEENTSLTRVDLNLTLSSQNNWLIEEMLFKGDLALLVGKEAVGKSFTIIDLAVCLATGTSWAGQQVRQCPVLYLALEGERGIRQRFIAQVQTKRSTFESQTIPLAFDTPALELCRPNAEETLMKAVTGFKAEFNCMPELIIIDTLAQAFGGEENSSEHMQACLKSLKAVIKKTGATILLVHHYAKDQKSGPRGHSSLAAACDTIFSLEKQGEVIVLSEQKQKDAESTFQTNVKLIRTTLESHVQVSETPLTTCLPSYSNTSKKGVTRDEK